MYFASFHLSSDQRIDCTSSCGCHRTFCHTGKTTKTFYNLIFLIFHDLSWKKWVCKQGSCHVYNICFSGSNDFFHLLWIIQSTNGRNRNTDMFFDLCCQIYITSMVFKHGWMCISKSSLISSCRYMENIHIWLNHLCDFHSF